MSANENGLEIILNDFIKKIPYNVFLTNFLPKKSDLSKYSYSYIFSKTQSSKVYCVHGKGEYDEIPINPHEFENLIRIIENDEKISVQGLGQHPIQFIEDLKYNLYLMRSLPSKKDIDNFKSSFIFISEKTSPLKIYIIRDKNPYEIRDIDEDKLKHFSIIDYNEVKDFKFKNEDVRVMQRIFLLQTKKIGVYLNEFEKIIQLAKKTKNTSLPDICSFKYQDKGIGVLNEEYEQNIIKKYRDINRKKECYLYEFLIFSVGLMFFEQLIKLRMEKEVDGRVFSNGGGEITIDDIVKCKEIIIEIYFSQLKILSSFLEDKKSILEWFELLEKNELKFSEKFKKIVICDYIGYMGDLSLSKIVKSNMNFCKEFPIMLSFSELSEHWSKRGFSGVESRICKAYLEGNIGCYLKADTDLLDSLTLENTAESEDIIVKWCFEKSMSDFSKKIKLEKDNLRFPKRYSGYIRILPDNNGQANSDVNLKILETKGSVKCNRLIYGSSSYKYNLIEPTDFEERLGIKIYLKTSYKSKKRFDNEIRKTEDYYFHEKEIEQYEENFLKNLSSDNIQNNALAEKSTSDKSINDHCRTIGKKGGKRPKANPDIQNLINVLYFIYSKESNNPSANNFLQWLEKYNYDTRDRLIVHDKLHGKKWVPENKRTTSIKKNESIPDVILESLRNLKYDHIIIDENNEGRKRITGIELAKIESKIDYDEYNSQGTVNQDEMVEDAIGELEDTRKDILALVSVRPYVKKAKKNDV